MEDRIIHSLAVDFANWLNKYSYKEGKDYLKVVYATEVMIMNISKLFIVFAVTVILGITVQTVAVLLGFNLIRRYAFGTHAGSSTACTIESMVLFVAIPYLLKGFVISNYVVLPIFCLVILCVYLFAPADTEARPLVGKKKRERLRKYAVISSVIVMIGVFVIGDGNIKAMVTLGAVYEIVSILPITYRIFNKRWHSYEKFEVES